jgi:hypothetical protein
MAKITVGEISYEGTPEELKEIFEMTGVKFSVEEIEGDTLKVGDLVRNVTGAWADKGVFGKITEVDESDFDNMPYCVKFETENVPLWVKVEDIEKATEEEVAQAKAEQSEKEIEARWAKIGRKPNEFREGDIVRVNDSQSTLIKNGEIGVIGEFDESDGFYRVTTVKATISNWHHPKRFELIAPVESRFDEAK